MPCMMLRRFRLSAGRVRAAWLWRVIQPKQAGGRSGGDNECSVKPAAVVRTPRAPALGWNTTGHGMHATKASSRYLFLLLPQPCRGFQGTQTGNALPLILRGVGPHHVLRLAAHGRGLRWPRRSHLHRGMRSLNVCTALATRRRRRGPGASRRRAGPPTIGRSSRRGWPVSCR